MRRLTTVSAALVRTGLLLACGSRLVSATVPVVLGRGLLETLLWSVILAALGLSLTIAAGRGLLVISLASALLLVSGGVLALAAELQGDHAGAAVALLVPSDELDLFSGPNVELEYEVAVVIRGILVPLVALDEKRSLAGLGLESALAATAASAALSPAVIAVIVPVSHLSFLLFPGTAG